MDRTHLIEIIKQHSNTVSVCDVENLADHILAAVREYCEKLESELTVKDITLSSFGIRRD